MIELPRNSAKLIFQSCFPFGFHWFQTVLVDFSQQHPTPRPHHIGFSTLNAALSFRPSGALTLFRHVRRRKRRVYFASRPKVKLRTPQLWEKKTFWGRLFYSVAFCPWSPSVCRSVNLFASSCLFLRGRDLIES